MDRRRDLGLLWVGATASLAVGVGLGSSRRLTYHEAIVAQGAREMLATGDWLAPTIGGVPWLEKPPLGHWLVAGVGALAGRVDEWGARLPSAIAAVVLALAVARLARDRFGRRIGLLAGLSQATTSWAVTRGRLAESDILLAASVAALMLAFDGLRRRVDRGESAGSWRLAFFALLGAMSLFKGIGFGAALALSAVASVLIWDRDARLLRALCWAPGWAVASLIALAWPLVVAVRFPEAPGLWLGHVTDRLADRPTTFAGEPTWAFLLAPLALALPWTPLALVGVRHSVRRARRASGRFGPDRLLLAWSFAPLILLSLATVKNDHYLIHALPPWSIWAARGWVRLMARLRGRRRGAAADPLRAEGRAGVPDLRGVFVAVALVWGLGFLVVGPRFDDRGREWAWYAEAGRHRRAGEPVVLLYDWDGPEPMDRLPYPTPFGPVPHDLAVRLFYLGRPAERWVSGADAVGRPERPTLLVARDRDLPALSGLGRLEVLDRSPPTGRADRAYVLARLTPASGLARSTVGGAGRFE